MMNKLVKLSLLMQKLIIITLIAILPVIVMFKPPASFYGYDPGYSNDPLYLLRATLILLGYTGAILSVFCLIVYLIFSRKEKPQIILQLTITLCAFALGWRYFPYCINGILRASIENVKIVDFYPGKLVPGGFAGEVWIIGNLLLYPIALMSGIGIIVFAIIIRNRLIKKHVWQIVILLVIIALTLVYSPGFEYWMAD